MFWKLEIGNWKFRQGYAALTMTMLVIFASLTVIGGLSFFSVQEVGVNRVYRRSVGARDASEAGLEDAAYRIVSGKQIGSSETITAGSDAATILVTTSPDGSKIIRSQGQSGAVQQNTEARIAVTTDAASFFYGVQVDAGGVTMGTGAQVNGNLFSNGSISGGTVTGSAVVATGLALSPAVEWPVGCQTACGNADNPFATTTTNQDVAQSFTATAAGALNKLSVFLGKNGFPAADITVRIAADSSGHPAASQIGGSGTIIRTGVAATPSWIDVIFSSPPNLTSGAKYWIVLDYGTNSATNYWNWRKDSSDGYAGNTGKNTTDWSSRSAAWAAVGGDMAFRVWIGGTNNQIAHATIGGVARAPAFSDVTAGGSSCPNASCVTASDPPQPLPISDGMIQGWRDGAAAGGACGPPTCDSSGNLDVSNGASLTLGPKKITGALHMDNGGILTLTGTVWVVGDVTIKNGSVVKLASGYGSNSGVLVADDDVDVHNGVVFSGSGTAGSYVMLLAAKNTPARVVMDIDNGSTSVIYYASRGRIHFRNSAAAKEAVAYGIDMDNSSTITYESGLQNAHFSSGPSGGYDVKYWKEVE